MADEIVTFRLRYLFFMNEDILIAKANAKPWPVEKIANHGMIIKIKST